MNTPVRQLIKQAQIVAILGALFVLGASVLQAFIEMPTLNHLMFDSTWFRVLLIAGLWLVAFLITHFGRDRKDG
jgi:hypothetical protein